MKTAARFENADQSKSGSGTGFDFFISRKNSRNYALASERFSASFTRLMAKTAWLERNARKLKTVQKYAELRAELKARKDYQGLSQLPRDASPVRVVNRCRVTGRRHAFMRRFQLSRLTFRELANSGMIPGVTKSSW